MRTLVWAIHGAAFATLFILIEVVAGAVLASAARRFPLDEAQR